MIDPTTGGFQFTPTAAQTPGVYPISFVVTDNQPTPRTATRTINVTVNRGILGSPATSFSGGPVNALAVGSFNTASDATPDLALADAANGLVRVRFGGGAGLFGGPSQVAVGASVARLAVGDFNADGRDDLAVTNPAQGTVSILFAAANGTFSAPTTFAVGSAPTAIRVSDFNGDGKADLAVANSQSSSVSVLIGDGAGGFAPANFPGRRGHPPRPGRRRLQRRR